MTRRSRSLKATIAPALLAAAALLAGCSEGGAGKPSEPLPPVPINTTTGWSDSPFISRDGQRLYFMYSRYDFAPWILSGGAQAPVLSGPDRPGLHHSGNPFDESDIYMATRRADGTWSEPVNLPFNDDSGDSSGMEIEGGNAFVWLHGSGSARNIVMARRNADGSWGSPVNLGAGINNHATGVLQDNPHISPDGNSLWFTSNRPGGAGQRDIWFSTRTGATWSTPVNIGPPVNTAGEEDQFWYSPVGTDMYWNGPTGLMRCQSNGFTCAGAPQAVDIPGCRFAAEASMPDDGSRLYFACSDRTTARARIMYSARRADGSWGIATPVD